MRLVFSFVLVWAIAYAEPLARKKRSATLMRIPENKIDYFCCGQRPLAIGNGVLEVAQQTIGHAQEAIPHSHPSLCSIRWDRKPNDHICSGALVKNLEGEYFIVAALYCVYRGYRYVWKCKKKSCIPEKSMVGSISSSFQYYKAHCGVHNRFNPSEPQSVIVRFSWMNYYRVFRTRDYCDIAILKLSTDLPFNLYISAACLPNEDWYEGEVGLFVGWYNKSDISPSLPKVHQFETRIRSRARCGQKYGSLFTQKSMCSSLPESGFNPCGYDIGAPLYTYRKYGWTLTGIGNLIPNCAEPDRLILYTDVFAHRGWINETINRS